jgi:hypothetical protein
LLSIEHFYEFILSCERIFGSGMKKQFETASLNGQILPLFTSLRFPSLGFSVGARKIGGSYQKSAASGGRPLLHSAGNSRGGLAIPSSLLRLISHFSFLISPFPPD